MSRQSKRARTRANRVKHAVFNKATHQAEPTHERGPKATTPQHGKRNRWPYDAKDPKRARQG